MLRTTPERTVPAQLPTIVIDSEIPCAFGRSLTLTTSTSIAEPDVNTCTPRIHSVWNQILWGERVRTKFHPKPARKRVPKKQAPLSP